MPTTTTESNEIDFPATLFVNCALPGCVVPVVTPGDVCSSCRHAFADMLRIDDVHGVDPQQVAAELAARDAGVLAQYRDRTANSTAAERNPTNKRNQACWLCEQRRTCTAEEMGWECRRCRDLPS